MSVELNLTVNGEPRTIALESPKFTIGRGPENSLCLPVSVVSRLHAEVIRLGQDFILRDQGSTNGSFINGSRVTELMLNDGDGVEIHQDFARLGPFARTDVTALLKNVEDTGRPRVTEAEPALEK